MRAALVVLLFLYGSAGAAAGNKAPVAIASDLTAEDVDAAIAAAKDPKAEGCYTLTASRLGIARDTKGCFSTPFSRVVGAARAAAEKYKPFTAGDVTRELVAPGELHVHGFSRAGNPDNAPAFVTSVQAIVVMPRGSKDKSKAIQPTSTTETPESFRNGFGASMEGTSMSAVFPLEVLSPDNEVRIVYDRYWVCDDCAIKFKLDKVR